MVLGEIPDAALDLVVPPLRETSQIPGQKTEGEDGASGRLGGTLKLRERDSLKTSADFMPQLKSTRRRGNL